MTFDPLLKICSSKALRLFPNAANFFAMLLIRILRWFSIIVVRVFKTLGEWISFVLVAKQRRKDGDLNELISLREFNIGWINFAIRNTLKTWFFL